MEPSPLPNLIPLRPKYSPQDVAFKYSFPTFLHYLFQLKNSSIKKKEHLKGLATELNMTPGRSSTKEFVHKRKLVGLLKR